MLTGRHDAPDLEEAPGGLPGALQLQQGLSIGIAAISRNSPSGLPGRTAQDTHRGHAGESLHTQPCTHSPAAAEPLAACCWQHPLDSSVDSATPLAAQPSQRTLYSVHCPACRLKWLRRRWVQGIRIIKFMNWESSFQERIGVLRTDEVRWRRTEQLTVASALGFCSAEFVAAARTPADVPVSRHGPL